MQFAHDGPRKLFQELFECYKKLMADWLRGYFKCAGQPKFEAQGQIVQ
jgi:hypothetical protein